MYAQGARYYGGGLLYAHTQTATEWIWHTLYTSQGNMTFVEKKLCAAKVGGAVGIVVVAPVWLPSGARLLGGLCCKRMKNERVCVCVYLVGTFSRHIQWQR